MNTKVIKALYKKEITDIFRDKKTIIIMVLIPLLLYPLLSLAGLFFSTKLITETTDKTYNVAIVKTNEEAANEVAGLLKDSLETKKYHFNTVFLTSDDEISGDVRNKKYDAVIVPKENEAGFFDYEIAFVSSSNNSGNASSMIKEVLNDNKTQIVEHNLREKVSNYDELTNPFSITTTDYSSKEETAGFLIGMVLPYLLIISVMTGVFYPAIDVSAGERERGTLETLMTLPIKTLDMTIAKFLAVSTVADFFMLLNIASIALMGVTAGTSINMFSDAFKDFKVTSYIPALLLLIVVFVIFVFFTSAVCLCVFFCAKTFKEANNLSSPIMLIFMFASMISLLPNVELNYSLAWIPIINVSLLVKSAFLLKFDLGLIAVVIVSNIIYTIVVVIIMAQIFSSEDILFGEGIRGVNIIEKRSNIKKGQIPGIGDVILVFMIILMVMLYGGIIFSAEFDLWGTGICQIFIFLIPAFAAWYMKTDIKSLFSLNKPRIVEIIGSVVIFVGFIVFEQGLMYFCQKIIPSMDLANSPVTELLKNAGLVPALIVAALLPPFAEEAAFRGYLMGTLKNKKIPRWLIIVLVGVAFGAYHLNLEQGIPAAFMGAVYAYMVLNSGSIWTSVLGHFLNNSLGVITSYYPEIWYKIPIMNSAPDTPMTYVGFIVVGLLVIALGIMFSDRKIGFFRQKESK